MYNMATKSCQLNVDTLQKIGVTDTQLDQRIEQEQLWIEAIALMH